MRQITTLKETYKGYQIGYSEEDGGFYAAWCKDGQAWTCGSIKVEAQNEVPHLAREYIDFNEGVTAVQRLKGNGQLSWEELSTVRKEVQTTRERDEAATSRS